MTTCLILWLFDSLFLKKVINNLYNKILNSYKSGAHADENGYFKLAVVNNEANDSLIITCIGYVPFKCAISSSNILSSGTIITKMKETANSKELI